MMKKLLPALLLLVAIVPALAQESSPDLPDGWQALPPREMLTLHLDDSTPSHQLAFYAAAESQWSLLAQSVSGDLDPVLRLYDEDAVLLLANDNQDTQSQHARLEAWTAPEDGLYRVELSRAGDSRARSSGTAELLLLDSPYSTLLSRLPSDAGLTLNAGDSLALAQDAFSNGALLLEMALDFVEGDAFWLRFVPEGAALPAWEMQFSREGWSLSSQGMPETLSQDVPLQAGHYRLQIRPQNLRLWLDGLELFALESPLSLLEGGGSLQLAAAEGNQATLTLRQWWLLSPFYNPRSLADATAPLNSEAQLQHYRASYPQTVIDELVALGYIEEGGGSVMRIMEGAIETGNPGLSTYPLSMGYGVQDFVLSFNAMLWEGGEGSACGVTFRQADLSNFSAALWSVAGNAYLLDYNEGLTHPNSRVLEAPMLQSGLDASNNLLVIAQGEEVALFVNGSLLSRNSFTARPGIVNFIISLQEAQFTRCYLTNIWLWSLDEERYPR